MPYYPLAVEVTPAGSDTQIQYNDNGAFGASAKLTFDDSGGPNILTLGAAGQESQIATPAGNGTDFNGCALDFIAGDGDPTNNGAGGRVVFYPGNSSTAGDGGYVEVGAGGSDSGAAGSFELYGGFTVTGTGGLVRISGGASDDTGPGGNLVLRGGYSENGQAGSLELLRGDTGAGTLGQILMTNLPTSDPGISGAVWANSNVLQVSP